MSYQIDKILPLKLNINRNSVSNLKIYKIKILLTYSPLFKKLTL